MGTRVPERVATHRRPRKDKLRDTGYDSRMTVADWLKAAIADAEKRGLPELKPLLEGLSTSMTALRNANFSGRADR